MRPPILWWTGHLRAELRRPSPVRTRRQRFRRWRMSASGRIRRGRQGDASAVGGMTDGDKQALLRAGRGAATFASAFGASPTPMVVTDARSPDNPIVWVNDAFLALTGYGRDELYGRNCRMLQGQATDPGEVRRMREAVTSAEKIECELFNYRKDGSAFWNAMTICPVRDAAGDVAWFFAAQADMTDKRRFQQAMPGTNDELERLVDAGAADLQAALEQKTALLHEVDHRVKNNLQVISSLMLLKAR